MARLPPVWSLWRGQGSCLCGSIRQASLSQRTEYSLAALARAAKPGPSRASSARFPKSSPPTRSAPAADGPQIGLDPTRLGHRVGVRGEDDTLAQMRHQRERAVHGEAAGRADMRHRGRKDDLDRVDGEIGQGRERLANHLPRFVFAIVEDEDHVERRLVGPLLSVQRGEQDGKALFLVTGRNRHHGIKTSVLQLGRLPQDWPPHSQC